MVSQRFLSIAQLNTPETNWMTWRSFDSILAEEEGPIDRKPARLIFFSQIFIIDSPQTERHQFFYKWRFTVLEKYESVLSSLFWPKSADSKGEETSFEEVTNPTLCCYVFFFKPRHPITYHLPSLSMRFLSFSIMAWFMLLKFTSLHAIH